MTDLDDYYSVKFARRRTEAWDSRSKKKNCLTNEIENESVSPDGSIFNNSEQLDNADNDNNDNDNSSIVSKGSYGGEIKNRNDFRNSYSSDKSYLATTSFGGGAGEGGAATSVLLCLCRGTGGAGPGTGPAGGVGILADGPGAAAADRGAVDGVGGVVVPGDFLRVDPRIRDPGAQGNQAVGVFVDSV